MKNIKTYAKRFAAMVMAIVMVMTSLPFNVLAANYDHNDLDRDKSKIINGKLPIAPAKEKKAEDFIKNPVQPAIYTLRTDYKVQKGEKYEINYQPYVASVGENATKAEKAKVNQDIKLPDLAGYDKSKYDDTYKIDYDTVKNAADGKNPSGDAANGMRYSASQDFKYKAKPNEIKIKHLFQDMHDFTKYTNPGGADKPEKITTQNGNTGSTMEASPLNENDRRGFVPEAEYITMQVPEDSKDFVLEYRYNRAHYNVDFDTKGGTPIPTRTYYYDQEIPKIENEDIPTKKGCIFKGWKPSHDLVSLDGKTYKKDEIIHDASGNAALNLDVKLKMPGLDLGKDEKSRERLTFTAVWEDKKKADYAIQFWVEKADHANDASLLNKYEYMGTHVHKNVDTGSKPNLDAEPVKKVVFPDLDQARLAKIWNGDKFYGGQYLYLNKFFVYNKKLTDLQNGGKTVSPTGETVYNIYYDRQVYDLYFTKSNALGEKETFYPEIYVPDGNGGAKRAGGPGNPYHYKARFNQLMLGWPNDAMQTKGFDEGKQSYGWGPNYGDPHWPIHLDTPPYRLNADEFLDMPNYEEWGGYVAQIDDGAGGTIPAKDFRTLSFGIKQEGGSMPHHMDFWMDGFKDGETIIRYDLYRSKADTNSPTYNHRYSRVQGFTPYNYTPGGNWPTIEEGKEEHGRITEDDIDTLNEERGEITPYPDKDYTDTFGFNNAVGQMHFRAAFFNNADEFGDALDGNSFKENGYIRFKYKRNKYPLRFNYDTSVIKDDSEFNSANQLQTFYEFPLKALSPDVDTNNEYKKVDTKEGPKNLIDNPQNLQTLGLTNLVFTDPKDGKLKVKRPEGLSDQMVFKGWALDPAGTKLVWENPKETMPTHALNLYAKWGEPDYKWKVTFDPDGGTLKTIKEENLTTERKTIQEGDIGQEEQNTYAKKGYLKEEPTTPDGKQIFTVIQRQKLVKPVPPEKKGYDFMGWEVIRYKKNEKGDYTDEVDTSYRDKYGVPELYTFGNDVVGPITLKAIWNPNQRVDVTVKHHFLDKDCKNDTKNPDVEDILENKRTGYYTATTGDRQGEKWILAPHEELEKSPDENVKKEYEAYNGKFGFNNTYFQTQRIEAEKIKDPNTGEMIPNPNYKGNVFHFFYRPFRHREYQVNYIDERGKKAVEDFFKGLDLVDTKGLTGDELLEANKANKAKFEAKKSELDGILEKHRIVDPETVTNGNRHYDARNYRPIPGWKPISAPQQQLFFDINEDTNEFLGINGTGSDQLFFYYKDARVIEVPKDDPVPEGYVRVTFKADKGGSFGKDAEGKDITELNYDVIKGLKSDLLPVPKELKKGEVKATDKYYVTPDDGKKFVNWDEKPLLNKNTIVDNDSKDFYVFTAKFEWSGLTASGLVKTEAFKDPNGTWTNDFAPKIEDLKKQLVWREKDQVKDLPKGTTIKLFDEKGNELTDDKQVFELVNEKNKADTDELVRTVIIRAKVTFNDKKETQELNIPITVYKNVYEALNEKGEKPLFLKEAESKEAKDGGLKDVTGDYVMVTVQPTEKNKLKDKKVYFVNPKAWVTIPEVTWSDVDKNEHDFLQWTADKVAQNENGKEKGIFDFAKRHKFTEETLIEPLFAKDVVSQEGNEKPKVPDNFVKVIVKTTDKATEQVEKIFWVNPTKEVTIPVANPTGKSDQEVEIPNLGKKKVNYVFNQWKKVQAGEKDDSLTKVDPAVKVDLGKNKYTDKVTVIEASYFERFAATPIIKPIKTAKLDTPEGKEITNDDLIKQITPPSNKAIESITVVEKPDPSKPGKQEAKVTIKYKDGSTQGTNDKPIVIPVEVHKNIIPEAPGGQKPKEALDNYVKVTFTAGEGGSVSGDLVYYVSPEVAVDMTDSAKAVNKKADIGYFVSGEKWTPEIKIEKITEEKTYVFNFDKSKDFVEKIDENTKIPKGYVKVTFKTDGNGKVDGKDEKIYYVNPKAGIKLGKETGDKILVVPTPTANANYVFKEWQENIDESTSITNDRTHVAIFKSGQVTLTYKAGDGATGDVPKAVTEDYGTTVQLAGKGNLEKANSEFKGWKLDGEDKIYQPGDSVKLEKARTATAQWELVKHNVMFDLAQGTIDGSTTKDSVSVVHGKTVGKITDPKREGYVFTGWKFGDNAFDPEKTPVESNVKLVAQWEKSVQPIKEDATVDQEHFIKVTFKQGDHGVLIPSKGKKDEKAESVTYKVAKNDTFVDAVKHGLVVPGIAPAKYYKVAEDKMDERAKHGWDKELNLTLEANETEKVFTAQYEPIGDVIPVDPTVTDKTQIQNEKPEGMVLVEFKVDESKAYMLGDTKFYVKKDEVVNIKPPLVRRLELGNDVPNDYVFKGWNLTQLNNEWKFTKDTTIDDGTKVKPTITIRIPSVGDSEVSVKEMTQGATAYLEVIRRGKDPVIIEAVKDPDYGTYFFDMPQELGALKKRDKIKVYAELNGLRSDTREYRVR